MVEVRARKPRVETEMDDDSRWETHEAAAERANPKPGAAPETVPVIEADGRHVLADPELDGAGPEYVEIGLPSGFLPYEKKRIKIRRFVPMDMPKLFDAKQNGDVEPVIDAIGSTIIGQSVDDLTTEDFHALMYWQRINSYLKSPLIIDWVSRYGNENKTEVRDSDLITVELDMTQEDWDAWQTKGFDLARVRDLRYASNLPQGSGDLWFFNRAQYLKADTPQAKVLTLQAYKDDLSIFEDIREFIEVTAHGIKEYIMSADKHFEPRKAAEDLRNTYEIYEAMLVADPYDERVPFFRSRIADLQGEYEAIMAVLEDPEQKDTIIAPREEEVTLTMNVSRFFPGI